MKRKEITDFQIFLMALVIAVAMAATIVLLSPYPEVKNLFDNQQTQPDEKDIAAGCVSTLCVADNWLEKHSGMITALATIAIAWFTWTLRRSSDELWEVSNRQANLARDEFNATHRARLYVQDTRYNRVNDTIEYSVINTGDAPATIVKSVLVAHTIIRFDDTLNFRPREGQNDIGEITLAPGEFYDSSMGDLDGRFMFAIGAAIGGDRNAEQIHFAGCIVYRDQSGLLRRMHFRRSYDPETSRFRMWRNDPETEWSH